MPPNILILQILGLLTLLPFAGTMRLLGPLIESAKLFRKFEHSLRKSGKYNDWAIQHLDLVVLDALLRYRGIIVLALVAVGFVPIALEYSGAGMTLFYVLAIGFWVLIYLGALRLSRLYATILKNPRV